jgi:hypothetical protein
LLDQFAWKAVGPKSVGSLAEGHLEFDFLGLMAILFEEVERVFEYLRFWLLAG